MTREHLPFKALYKGIELSAQDSAAIIKICTNCNQEKSIWDQEFLAAYGHLLELDRAEKAQLSLKKIEQVSSGDLLVKVAARTATSVGESFMTAGGIPVDIVSQWFYRCGRGIYYYFEQKPFNGTAVSICPNIIDHNIKASNFTLFASNSTLEGKQHWINDSCFIALLRRSSETPMIMVSMINKRTDKIFSVIGFFEEELSQREADKNNHTSHPDDVKPMRVAQPREIFDVHGGVKKLKK